MMLRPQEGEFTLGMAGAWSQGERVYPEHIMVPNPKSTLSIDGAHCPGDGLDSSNPNWKVPLQVQDPLQKSQIKIYFKG